MAKEGNITHWALWVPDTQAEWGSKARTKNFSLSFLWAGSKSAFEISRNPFLLEL